MMPISILSSKGSKSKMKQNKAKTHGIYVTFCFAFYTILLMLLLLSPFSHSDSVQPFSMQPASLLCPWHSLGMSGLPSPPPGYLSNPGIEPESLASPARAARGRWAAGVQVAGGVASRARSPAAAAGAACVCMCVSLGNCSGDRLGPDRPSAWAAGAWPLRSALGPPGGRQGCCASLWCSPGPRTPSTPARGPRGGEEVPGVGSCAQVA